MVIKQNIKINSFNLIISKLILDVVWWSCTGLKLWEKVVIVARALGGTDF